MRTDADRINVIWYLVFFFFFCFFIADGYLWANKRKTPNGNKPTVTHDKRPDMHDEDVCF